jgi:signal transduction histidine kinase/CheY-like chemotaxis protein
MRIRAIHLEDDEADALFVRKTLQAGGIDAEVTVAASEDQYLRELESGKVDLIMVDNGLPGFNGAKALQIARERHPEIPFIFVTAADDENLVAQRLAAGATDYVLKSKIWQLPLAVRRAAEEKKREAEQQRIGTHNAAMKRLVSAVQQLSLARSLDAVMAVVRRAARELTGADGATFVLRDNGQCYYADEDAISPLWKGQRFPMSACISGWAMLNKQPAVIEDIYADARIPADAYRPTFVKSLVMVPIRTTEPIGAIGNYWAHPHRPTAEEVEVLQALANTTAVAMESVELYSDLERRVQDRTRQLHAANQELEAFSYSVSHDLQAPLRAIGGFTDLVREECETKLSEQGKRYLEKVIGQTKRMGELIGDLLRLARLVRADLRVEKVELSRLAQLVCSTLQSNMPQRVVDLRIEEGLEAQGDAGLLRVALENLLSNAWKYTSKRPSAVIEFGMTTVADGERAFFVRDNGAGFDMTYATRLFAPFQRMHRPEDFPGNGVGLATVQRIVHRHGGRLWVETAVDQGATFFFTLPESAKESAANSPHESDR